MAFVQFTRPDDSAVIVNAAEIVSAAPVPDNGPLKHGTRITFTNGGHQDVKELVADVLRKLNIAA